MRKLLIAIVLIGGLASVALCGGYGWDQGAGVLKDQITQAFIFGMVAVFTLALHVAGIRMWIQGSRKLGALVVFAGFLAFVMTAFTGLGGLASRSDRFTAERQDALDTKADNKQQIADLMKERRELRFTHTMQSGVDAAQRVANAAKLARERECGVSGLPKDRGPFCRQKEIDEGTALTAVAAANTNKTATDRSIWIDGELKRLRSLKTDGTVGTANPLRDLLATIIGAWADLLTSWQKAAFVVIYDICLIAAMIAIEVIGQGQNVAAKSARREDAPGPVTTIEPEVAPTNVVPLQPRAKRAAPTITEDDALDPNPVIKFMVERVRKVAGEDADWADIMLALPAWWTEKGIEGEPPTPAQLGAILRFISEPHLEIGKPGMRTRKRGGRVFFVDRKVI